MTSSTRSHIHLRSMQQCKLRPYSHIQANYGHASKKKLVIEATRRLPWYACTCVCVCALVHWVISCRIPQTAAHLLAEMHLARDASSDDTCSATSPRSRPTTSLRHANYSTRPLIKSNAATISQNLICIRPTSGIRTTTPGLFGPIACRVAIMIAAKNGAMTTATGAMTTGQEARGPGNFIDADQIMSYATDQPF